MTTVDTMDCGEVSCEYCTKDRCIYMKDTETERKKKMTKKEALDWLISRKEHYEMDDNCQELAEAIGIGIDAIKQEIKTGHWVYDREHCDCFNVAYTCSCCERRVFVSYPFAMFYELKRDVYKSYPYCHCGAKMLEVEE